MHMFDLLAEIIERLPTWLEVIRELLSNLGII